MSEQGIGFVCAAVAVLFFGSNFIPVKKYETGDGLFFQWIMCTAIWIGGFLVNVARGFPEFQPLAMLGGFLWCTGNVMVVPIVKMIGLSLGLLLWGSVNLMMGWSSGTFGLFGLTKESVPVPWLNYLGFCMAVLSIFIYVFIKTETKSIEDSTDPERKGLITNDLSPLNLEETGDSWVDRLNPSQKKIAGVVLSVVSGIFYGVNFDPPTYLMDKGGPQNGLDYVFSHFCGIYLTSTAFFIIYCIAKRNKPVLYPKAVLPAFVCGALWAVADICWFVANAKLDLVVAFPIITTGPGVIAALWGIFVFKEIQGKRNIAILLTAFVCTFTAVAMITLSKVLKH